MAGLVGLSKPPIIVIRHGLLKMSPWWQNLKNPTRDMSRALHLSMLLHVGIIFGVLFLARHPTPAPPPLIIDFSMIAGATEPGKTAARTSKLEEQQTPPTAPPAREETVVEKRNEPEKLHEKPLEIPKEIVPKVKFAREKIKKHLQPTMGKIEENPHPPPIEKQDHPSAAIATEKTSTDETAGTQPAVTETQAESGRGDNGGSKTYDFAFVRNLIVKNLSFPAIARRMSLTGEIVVAFLLKEDGQVADIAIVESSGHDILDNNVVATIRRISPFPKPPAAARIVLPITFHLK